MMQKQSMLTLALFLYTAHAVQSLKTNEEQVQVVENTVKSIELPAATTLQSQTTSWPNMTIGENHLFYTLTSPVKEQVEASRFLLEQAVTPCIDFVSVDGNGPAVCHPATVTATSFADFPDQAPILVDYLDPNSLPIEIVDQRFNEGEVDFLISQNWLDVAVPVMSVGYRSTSNEDTCSTYRNVPAGGWQQVYTAQCVFGKADVKLYFRYCDKDQTVDCGASCDFCGGPMDGDDDQYTELTFEIDCDPRCAIADDAGFNPFDLPCEDEDTEKLDGFLGNGVQDCASDLVEIDEENLPIRVVERSRDGETVIFQLTQDYYEGAVVKWGVHHRANATFQDCDVEHNIAYGETRNFTTKCWYGQAAVTLYVYMCELEPHDDCNVCEAPESMDNFMQYAYNIACYRPCDNDTDIIPFFDPTPPPTPETQPPEDTGNDIPPELPGYNNCARLTGIVGNGGSACTFSGEYQNLITDPTAVSPIDIVTSDGNTVEFKVSQHFVQGGVYRFSVYYDGGNVDHECDSYHDILPSWDGTFSAVCNQQKTVVKFYLRFCTNGVERASDFCETPDSLDDYLELEVELDCSATCDQDDVQLFGPSSPDSPSGPVSDGAPSGPTEPSGPNASPNASPSSPQAPSEPSSPSSPDGSPNASPSSPQSPSEPSSPTTPSGPTEPSGPTTPSGPTEPSAPSGPNASPNASPSSPQAPSEPSSPSSPDGSPNASPSSPTTPSGPTEPSGPTTPSGPTEPSGPTTPSGPTEPSGPTTPSGPTEPSAPSGPNASPNASPSSPQAPSEPSSPTTPSGPTEPSGPTTPSGPTEPSGPTTPSGPTEPVTITADCTELPDSPCEYDVQHWCTTPTSGTMFTDPPIRIISQTDTTVEFSVDNTFGGELSTVYIEYYSLADGTPSCVGESNVGLCAADNLSYTAHCTGGLSPAMTLVDMWVYAPDILASTDNAAVPESCGSVGGGSNTVKYTFALFCESTCVAPSRRLRGGAD